MPEDKVYTFKPKSIVIEMALVVLLSGVIVYFFISIPNPIAVLLIYTIPGYIAYLQYRTTTVAIQYNKYDKGKQITIDASRTILTFTQGDATTVVKSEDVDYINIYESTNLGKFGTYNYIIIHTINNQQILITKYTIPLLVYDKALEKFLRKKNRVYFKKMFNYIEFPLV